jgi:hypothetical protein
VAEPARSKPSTLINDQIATLVRYPNPLDPSNVSRPSPLDEYLTSKELAAKLRASTRTLDRWHAARTGPPRISVSTASGKRSRTIFYKESDVAAWLDSLATKPCRTRGRKAE